MPTDAYRLQTGAPEAPFVLTCEHASAAVPERYGSLGLAPDHLADHMVWDIGAAAVARLSGATKASALAS